MLITYRRTGSALGLTAGVLTMTVLTVAVAVIAVIGAVVIAPVAILARALKPTSSWGIEYQSTSEGGTAVAIRLGSGVSRSDGGDAPREDPASQEVEGDGEARPAT